MSMPMPNKWNQKEHRKDLARIRLFDRAMAEAIAELEGLGPEDSVLLESDHLLDLVNHDINYAVELIKKHSGGRLSRKYINESLGVRTGGVPMKYRLSGYDNADADADRLEELSGEVITQAFQIAKTTLRGIVEVGQLAEDLLEDFDMDEMLRVSGDELGQIHGLLNKYNRRIPEVQRLCAQYEDTMLDFWEAAEGPE